MKKIIFIVAAFILFFSSCGSNPRPPAPSPDRSSPVPASDEFVTVASDEGLTLQYRESLAQIRLIDKNRNIWDSTPVNLADDDLARGQVKMALSSLITATFLSRQGNESYETAMAASVRQGGASAYLIPNGIRVDFYFPAQLTAIPVEFVLDSGNLLVSVNPARVEVKTPDPDNEEEMEIYNRDLRLTHIGLLPYFIHADNKREGYILVPDGSGALINLNNGRPRSTYSQPVYGSDRINPPIQRPGGTMDALLPVFGMKRDSAAVFAVIESGAALASITAATAGDRSSYNAVSAAFTIRPPGTYTVTDAQGRLQEIKITSEWPVDVEKVSIRYFFLEPNAGYSEMAQAYRNYLSEQGMKPRKAKEGLPLVLDVYGSVTRRRSLLGIPMNINTALTGFDQATAMANELAAGGIEHLILRYMNWLPRGNQSTSPGSFSPSGKLGGKSGFDGLSKKLSALGAELYMDADFTVAYNKPLPLTGRPVVRNVSNMPVNYFNYDLSVYTKIDRNTDGWWLYSPRTFLRAADTFYNSAKNFDIRGISLSTLSNSPYGDAGKQHADRGAAEIILSEAAARAKNAMGGLMGDAACAYWLPCADFILNSPAGSSGFAAQDTGIPFYQMVLSGHVEYSLPAYNLSADREGQVLKAAETGAYLQLSVIANNPALVKETPLEWLYSPSFDEWKDEALAAAKRLKPVYEAINGSRIKSHTFLAEGVTQTEYENGAVIIVNYSQSVYNQNALSVPARDFLINK